MNLPLDYYDLIFAYGVTLCWALSIYFNAKGDALIDNDGRRKHGIEGFSEGFAVLGAGLIWYALTGGYEVSLFTILKYPFLRFGMFNLVYNANRKPELKWSYLGQTDWFDRQLIKVRDIGKHKGIVLFILYFLVFFTALFLN